MKTLITLAMVNSVLLVLAPTVVAQVGTREFDPLGEIHDLPKMIRVQVEYIEMSHETLTDLMSDSKIETDTVMRAKLGELVKQKEAKILETQIVLARPGQKATTESIEEYIYPTEYDPAGVPEKVQVKNGGEEGNTAETGTLAVGPTPTAFETRNLGSTLEIEPNIGANDKIIDLRFAPELVYHVRNEVWAEWKDERSTANIQMPVMYSMRTSTGITVADGEYRMVSTMTPKGPDGHPDFDRKIMLFVKCDLVLTGR